MATIIRIELVTPIVTPGVRRLEELAHLTGPKLVITHSLLENGPRSIQTEEDEKAAVHDTIKRVQAAEATGAHAAVVDCFGDPGVVEAQKVVNIPVFGPGATTMRKSAVHGRFGVVTVLTSVIPIIQKVAGRCGLEDKLASVRAINIPVLEIETRLDEVKKGLQREALRAVMEDGACAIMLGCTGFYMLDEETQQFLKDNGYPNIPVYDPIIVAIREAEAHVKAQLGQN